MAVSIWFPIHRIGPYHHARFHQVSQELRLTVIETRPASQEYPWDGVTQGTYPVVRLPVATNPEADPSAVVIDRELRQLLAHQGAPDVLVCMGWADRFSRRLLLLARSIRVPVVMVSDSRWNDQLRHWPQEWIKSVLLRQMSSALVAGSESRSYLERLGFPAEAIFQPWDVVDNSWFSGSRCQEQPSPHFLCVSRLVAKKNHIGLLQAYGLYQAQGGHWGLRLVGSGPMEIPIREAIAALPHPSRVRMEPFQQADQLPLTYQQASAFVLASHSDQWGLVVNEAIAAGCPVLVSSGCGCAADLVEHSRSGWVFDPDEPKRLADLMLAIAALPAEQLQLRAAAACVSLQRFSLASFVTGLCEAVAYASQHRRHSLRATMLARVLR